MMKMLLMLVVVFLLLITGCGEQVSELTKEPEPRASPALSEQEIRQHYPDGLDEALEGLEMVEMDS